MSTRRVFGAYFVAVITGFIFSVMPMVKSFNVAFAAVISVVLMTVLEFQHPPAIGIAVATVLHRFTFWTDVIVVLCIFFILYITLLLKYILREPQRLMNFVEIEEEKIKWKFRSKEKPEYLKI